MSDPKPRDYKAERERRRPAKCKRCRRPHGEVHVSFRGLCTECSVRAVTTNIRSIADRTGPEYEKWLKAQRAYLRRLDREARKA